ncbi:MAG: plasmid mobilization relaxosome protein MobC [Oscillospiraceae bacterium]|nr:plasmid mobilization relaxosome protein MobC [Oscillospiraceae bacterium]
MQKLKRNIALTFRVSADEQEQIKQKMELAGIHNLRAFLLKMALTGRVIQLDLTNVRECSCLLGNIAGNVNQIAKCANETGSIYADDIAGIQAQMAEFRAQQNKTIKILSNILEI